MVAVKSVVVGPAKTGPGKTVMAGPMGLGYHPGCISESTFAKIPNSS
jgi:hypothetical protein